MLRLSCLVLLGIFLTCPASHARVVVKEQELFYKEERVDGKIFAHRDEIRHDGVGFSRKEVWKIDGKEVTAQVYEQEILEAEKNERRAQRAQEEQARSAQIQFKEQAQRALLTKLLRKVMQHLMKDIQTLELYGLGSYAFFSDATISAHEYQEVITDFMPRAHALVAQECPDTEQVNQLYKRLEPLQDRMKLFMRATIDRAIEKCDDTKVLKELLTLVS